MKRLKRNDVANEDAKSEDSVERSPKKKAKTTETAPPKQQEQPQPQKQEQQDAPTKPKVIALGLPSKYGCREGWDDLPPVPTQSIYDYMKDIDEKFILGLKGRPHNFHIEVHKKFDQPYGGKATKTIRNAYNKRKADLGLTVKDGEEGDITPKMDFSEA